MDNSRIDEFFEEVFGFRPTKNGAAYELLVAAAFKLLGSGLRVKSNQFVQGTFSKEKYQIDAVLETLNSAVEAKDYTDRRGKVGRPDLTKLAGSLQDLPFNSGVVASATDFTRPARRYAEATKVNRASKAIDLYHVRPSVQSDEDGRIRSVALQMFILTPNFKNARFEPIITARGNEVLKGLYRVDETVQTRVWEIYKADGSVIITIFELTAQITRVSAAMLIEDSWIPSEPAYIKIADTLIEISQLKYSIPRAVEEIRVEIQPRGQAKLLIRSEDGTVDKLLTDEDLKRVKFSEDGGVEIVGSSPSIKQ